MFEPAGESSEIKTWNKAIRSRVYFSSFAINGGFGVTLRTGSGR